VGSVKGLLIQHGYTIAQTARILGVDPKQIYYWDEKGIPNNSKYYPTLKEIIPELKGREPKKAGPKLKELQLTETDLEPPPEEIPFSSPLPTKEEIKRNT
jgi:hypothetical protein